MHDNKENNGLSAFRPIGAIAGILFILKKTFSSKRTPSRWLSIHAETNYMSAMLVDFELMRRRMTL